jgi:hypothetical protein
MRTLVKNLLPLIGFVLLCSCAKPAAPAPSVDSSKPAASSTDPAEADRAALLNRLTQTLRRYSAEHQKVPKDLQDLVAAGYLQELPEPPAGKKYVIDDQVRVTLQNAK